MSQGQEKVVVPTELGLARVLQADLERALEESQAEVQGLVVMVAQVRALVRLLER